MVVDIQMGIWAWLIVIVAAIVLGVAMQFVGRAGTGYEWIVTAIGGAIGAVVASEFIVGWQDFEPVVDGLAIIPALIGGLVVGIVAGLVTRYLTGGSILGGVTAE